MLGSSMLGAGESLVPLSRRLVVMGGATGLLCAAALLAFRSEVVLIFTSDAAGVEQLRSGGDG